MTSDVCLYILSLTEVPKGWEEHLGLVAPRYREKSVGKAPLRPRLGEFGAGLLLACFLGVTSDEDLTLGQEGKLALANDPATHFNLSHDDSLAVLGVGQSKLGVDVEEIPVAYEERHNAALRFALSPEQLARVESSPDPAESFARAWTMVESVLKADGRGFSYPVRGGHLPEGYRTVVHALTGQDGQRHMLSLSVPADVEPRLTLVRLNIADVVNQLERGRRTSL